MRPKLSEQITPLLFSRQMFVCKMLDRYLKKDYPTCLEIGCGTGDLLAILEKGNLFSTIKGVDFSEESVTVARKKCEKARIYQEDFLNIREKFDVVIMLDVLEHIEHDAEALKNISGNLVSKNGLLFLSVPSSKAVHLADVGHYRHYKKEGLSELLTKTGFKVLFFYSYGTKLINRLGGLILKSKHGLNREQKTMREASKESGRFEFPFIYKSILYPVLRHSFFLLHLVDYYFLKNTDKGMGYLVLCRKEA